MKKITKIIALIMVAVFIAAPVTQASDSTYTYQSDHIEITITHSGLSEEQLLYIVQLLESGETKVDAQTYGLTCTLFGHKLVTTVNEVITHMVYDTYPHCKRECYNTTICERCDYAEVELISTEAVGCCVE